MALACRDNKQMGRRSDQGNPGSEGKVSGDVREVGGLAGLSLELRPAIREADMKIRMAWMLNVKSSVQRFLAP